MLINLQINLLSNLNFHKLFQKYTEKCFDENKKLNSFKRIFLEVVKMIFDKKKLIKNWK